MVRFVVDPAMPIGACGFDDCAGSSAGGQTWEKDGVAKAIAVAITVPCTRFLNLLFKATDPAVRPRARRSRHVFPQRLELPRTAGIPSEALPDKKTAKLSKITARDYLAEIACRQTLCRKVLTQPRPIASELGAEFCNAKWIEERACWINQSALLMKEAPHFLVWL
jgi:hypothetical protein